MLPLRLFLVGILGLTCRFALAGAPEPAAAPPLLVAPPTLADVSYGPHARNVLDFWRAPSSRPTPLVIYIHGGGFTAGDKSGARREALVQACLDAGVSVAAINYRYLAADAPMPEVLHDCARAVQFIRSQADAWNLDRTRFAAYGGSAGAGVALWLAFHDDFADPSSPDRVRRESSRLACAGGASPQASYDPLRWYEMFGEEVVNCYAATYRSPALFGFATDEALRSPAGQAVRAECDLLSLISKDDPPVFLDANGRSLALTSTNNLLHHPLHARRLYELCRERGVKVVAIIPAYEIRPADGDPATLRAFLFHWLKVAN